jgi:hypothetical protein
MHIDENKRGYPAFCRMRRYEVGNPASLFRNMAAIFGEK